MSEFRRPWTARVPALSVLQVRDFRFIWSSDVLDNICRWMELLVLSLLMLELTRSAFWVALVGTMRFSPMLFFGIFSGLIADRVNRWLVMVTARGSNIVVSAVLLALILGDWIEPWHILLGALAVGWTFVLDMPSRQSVVYDLVGVQNFVRAQSLIVINFTLGRIAGPALGGLFIETTGFGGAYMFLVALYIPTFILISMVGRRIPRSAINARPVFRSIATGIRYAATNPMVRAVLLITLVINALGFSALQLYPVVAKEHLGVGAGLTGVLLSADGIGMLIGAAIIGSLGSIRYHGRLFGAGSALVLFSVLMFVLSPWYPVSFLVLMVAGLGNAGFGTMQSTIIMGSAQPDMRGTAIGVMSLCIGLGPIGTLELGGLTSLMDTRMAIGINATVGLLLMLPVVLFTPLVRRRITPLGERTQAPPASPGQPEGQTEGTEGTQSPP